MQLISKIQSNLSMQNMNKQACNTLCLGRTVNGMSNKPKKVFPSPVMGTTSGQSCKQFTLVINESRVVIWGIFKSGTTLEY